MAYILLKLIHTYEAINAMEEHTMAYAEQVVAQQLANVVRAITQSNESM